MIKIIDWQLDRRVQINRLNLSHGTFVHLLGPNGAGKSSLLAGLAGIETGSKGRIEFLQRPIQDWNITALTAQRCFLYPDIQCQFELTVTQILGFFSGQLTVPESIENTLEINQLRHLTINRLSSGQQQRVHLARVLMQVWPSILKGEALILLDEPLRALDIPHQQSCLSLLHDISTLGNLVVMSCHDINMSLQFASHVALIKAGELLDYGISRRVITTESLKSVFNCDFRLVYSENAYDFYLPRVNSCAML